MTAHPAHWALDLTVDGDWEWLFGPLETGGSRETCVPPSPVLACTDRDCVPGFAAYTLDRSPESPRAARNFAQATLRAWAMEELVDNVAVVVSELVTNALRYGQRRSSETACARRVWVGLLRQDRRLLCAVADPGGEIPVLKEPDHLAESGRGLHVIAAVTEAWGWTPPDHSGKVVWAMFAVPGPGRG